MILHRAKHTGLCYGVRRATRLACELASQGHRQVLTLGPLMHNPQEVKRLAALGIEPRDSLEQCVGQTTLIRTHGISLEERSRATALGVDLVDATCPHVKVPHRHIEDFAREGRHVILVGDRDHPEVEALLSHADRVTVVSQAHQLPDLPADVAVGLVAQTTQSWKAYDQVAKAARAKYAEVVVRDTICEDARLRQQEGRRLAGEVDVMIVVGGRNSANTRRLVDICRSVQPATHHVESADELDDLSLDGAGSVGLISGASTPEWIISELEDKLRSGFIVPQ